MSTHIHPKKVVVDGLSIRYAEGGQNGADAILMSPWPESIFAFEQAWTQLAAVSHLVAIDPPGFGGSEYRQSLMNPKAMGHFILKIVDALGLRNPHIVGPDIGTSSVLFAAAAEPGRFRSIIVGSGASAVPSDVNGALKEWVEATDLEPYRQIGGRKIVEMVLETIARYKPSDEIREDYMVSYAGDRFAKTIPYVQSYREHLPELAQLLPGIQTPVRIVAGANDQVVPASNAEFLRARLPNAEVDLIPNTGHFCWEENPAGYASRVADWWNCIDTLPKNETKSSLNMTNSEVLGDVVLVDSKRIATIHAPVENVDIADWLLHLPDAEYQRCAPPDHIAAGTTTTDDGRPMSINVETIGGSLMVQHYVAEIREPHHCRMVSLSDVQTPTGWTKIEVIWDLSVTALDSGSCQLTNQVLSYPTSAFLGLLKTSRVSFQDTVANRQAASDEHNRRETALFAKSLERKALSASR